MVPDLAARVRRDRRVGDLPSGQGRVDRRRRLRRVRADVLDALEFAVAARRTAVDLRGPEPHQLPLSVDDHAGGRVAARCRRGVLVASVALVECEFGADRPAPRSDRRGCPGDDRVRRRRRSRDRRVRVPVAAAARVDPVARGDHGGGPSGGGRDAAHPVVDSARRGRQAELWPLSVELADLRDLRCHRRVGVAVRAGDDGHRLRDRGVVPLARDPGARGCDRELVEQSDAECQLLRTCRRRRAGARLPRRVLRERRTVRPVQGRRRHSRPTRRRGRGVGTVDHRSRRGRDWRRGTGRGSGTGHHARARSTRSRRRRRRRWPSSATRRRTRWRSTCPTGSSRRSRT